MQQYNNLLDENANFNNDYTFTDDSMHKGAVDHIDRARQTLKNIQAQNQLLNVELNTLKQDPMTFVKQIRDQVIQKINQLKQENCHLKRLVGNSKLPTYSSIKKKQVRNQNFMDMSSRKSSMRQSLRNSITARTVLSEIDSNVDKQIASTCQNQGQPILNPILKLKKPTSNEAAIKQKIQQEISLLLAKTQVFQGQIKSINKKQIKESQKQTDLTDKQLNQLRKIEEYKKKLLRLLNKLKSRQCASNQMIKAYKKLHEQTIMKLKQTTQTLNALENQKIQEDIEEKYQEALYLQERLQIISAQLDEMDETKWIQSVFEQLLIVCKRLGIKVAKRQNIRQVIDELCQNLIEHHLSSRKDNGMRFLMLKQYQEEQKKNNQKLLGAMKNKEQALGRKLIELQMESNK